jgi:predicted choloylglycine hydrolase
MSLLSELDRMEKTFVAEREDRPGMAWLRRFQAGREEAARWYLGNGLTVPPTASECRAALRQHMPELIPHYDHVCGLVGDDDLAHRILSHYRPAALPHGCSQAVWLGDDGPALIRNYDFPLHIVSDRIELTAWSQRRVIAKIQRPWGGCLDGMNNDGLVVSLTLGGSGKNGLGFAIILMLRYVLETCRSVYEATTALCRIPVAQPQNVTLLDRTGDHATLFLGPDREPAITRLRVCTNHQEMAPPASRSALRQCVLNEALAEPSMTLSTLVGRFFEPPLYSRHIDFTTVYTAVYQPAAGRVNYLWPGRRWTQGFDGFNEGVYAHTYGDLIR